MNRPPTKTLNGIEFGHQNDIIYCLSFSKQETLTGFKWIANRAVDFQNEGKVVLFSFEEAIGEFTSLC